MCPPKLLDHLALNAARLDTYAELKEEIVAYVTAKKAKSAYQGPIDMEMNSLVKGGGKNATVFCPFLCD